MPTERVNRGMRPSSELPTFNCLYPPIVGRSAFAIMISMGSGVLPVRQSVYLIGVQLEHS